MSERHFCCALEPAARLAEIIDDADDLGLHERHLLCQSPLDARDTLHANCLRLWSKELSAGGVARLRYAPPERPPRTHAELQALESYFRALDGYMWLAQRFTASFTQVEKVTAYRYTCAAMIEAALEELPPMADREERERARTKISRMLASRKKRPRGDKAKGKQTWRR